LTNFFLKNSDSICTYVTLVHWNHIKFKKWTFKPCKKGAKISVCFNWELSDSKVKGALLRAFRRGQKNIFFCEFLFSKIDHFSFNVCPRCNVWTFQLLIVLVYVTSPQCQGFLSILQLISVTIIMLLLKKSPWDNKVLRRFWEEIFSQKVISFYDRFFS